jgi:hypothetical protein
LRVDEHIVGDPRDRQGVVEGVRSTRNHLRASAMLLIDGENFDLVAAHQDNFTRSSADQSPRDGRDVRY